MTTQAVESTWKPLVALFLPLVGMIVTMALTQFETDMPWIVFGLLMFAGTILLWGWDVELTKSGRFRLLALYVPVEIGLGIFTVIYAGCLITDTCL